MFSDAIYHAPSPGLSRLIAAKDFVDQQQKLFAYDQNIVEKVGRAFRYGVGSLLDVTFQNIRNPLVLVSLTGAAMFGITVAFYHVAAHKMLITFLPVAAKIEAWMLNCLPSIFRASI